MTYLFYTLTTITTILIIAFLAFWTYARWKKIANQDRKEWHSKVFLALLGSTIVGVLLTMIVFYAK